MSQSLVTNIIPRGSTARTAMLAEDAARYERCRWSEWHQLLAKNQPDDYTDFAQLASQYQQLYSNLTPLIRPGELIVGARYEMETGQPGADNYARWDPEGNHYVGAFAERLSAYPYLHSMAARGLFSPVAALNHRVADFAALIATGSQALVTQAEEQIATKDESVRKFALAFAQGHNTIMKHARNYCDAVKALARETSDPSRKAELLQIADICAQVPANKATSFHQAVQSFWFYYMAGGVDIGRIDQYLYPYYQKDISSGNITRAKAQEIIECLLIKLHRDYADGDMNVSSIHTLTLGGLTPSGEDACNELTEIFLQAAHAVRLLRPSIYLRCHPGTPHKYIDLAFSLLADGLAEPSFYGDLPIIEGLLRLGVSLEEARNYALGGCTEVVSSGHGNWGAPNGWINIALLVDDALRQAAADGVTEIAALWEIIEAKAAEVALACRDAMIMLDNESLPNYAFSLLMPCCLERRKDVTCGGAESNMSQWAGVGLPNAADMLYSAAQLSFAVARPLQQLIADCDAGNEQLQHDIARLSKYGNGRHDVDQFAARLVEILSIALEAQSTPLRSHFSLGHLSGGENMHIDYGRFLSNTLDGRQTGKPLADSLAASQGKGIAGATALLHSSCTLDHSRLQAGNITTLMLNPVDFKREDGIPKMRALLKTFLRLGGSQLQFNLVDAEILRQAQQCPAEHAGLLVRVAGYSADFTHIGPRLQAEIISRFAAAK